MEMPLFLWWLVPVLYYFPSEEPVSSFQMSWTEPSNLQFVVTALWYTMSYYQEKKIGFVIFATALEVVVGYN